MKIMTIIWGLKYAISWLRCIIYELRCTKKNTKHYKVKNKKVLEVLGPSTQVLCYQVQVLPSTFTWSRSQVQVLHQVLIFCTWYQVLKYKYCTWYNPVHRSIYSFLIKSTLNMPIKCFRMWLKNLPKKEFCHSIRRYYRKQLMLP